MKLKVQFLVIIVAVTLFNGAVFANQYFLTASEINKKFTNHTMTITEAPDRKTGKSMQYKAYIDHSGFVRVKAESGAMKGYNWSTREEGRFCVKNNMRINKSGGASCGYFEDAGDGTYNLYNVKGAESREGAVVHYNKKKLLLSISNLQEGYQLKK